MATRDRIDQQPENLDFFALEHVNDSGNYGIGEWWYFKSHETYDRKHPFRRLLSAGQRDFMDTLTHLCHANKSWAIRVSAKFISDACGGNPAPRTAESYFAYLRTLGFVALKVFDKKRGNVYVVNPILMRPDAAAKFHHYPEAIVLLARVRGLEAPPRQPQKRRNPNQYPPLEGTEEARKDLLKRQIEKISGESQTLPLT